jgi:hypothetical protein
VPLGSVEEMRGAVSDTILDLCFTEVAVRLQIEEEVQSEEPGPSEQWTLRNVQRELRGTFNTTFLSDPPFQTDWICGCKCRAGAHADSNSLGKSFAYVCTLQLDPQTASLPSRTDLHVAATD